MTSVEERIEKKLKESALMDFLGSGNVANLKKGIADAILNRVIEDLDCFGDYIVDPGEIAAEITEEVKAIIKPKLQEKIYNDTMKKLGLED